jgi:hypothetical protein
VSGQPPLDLDAVARLANAVRSRHCEPGGDRQSYNLAQAALRLLAERDAETAGWRSSDHRFDEESVLNPVTGKPYGPGPLWAGTEPMDYPDPHCVCGAPWVDHECSRVGELHRTRAERDDHRAR